MKYRKFKRLIRRTSAVLGAGMAVGTVSIIPMLAPVTNVYAASSYSTAQSEYETKLATAKKTKNLTVNETEETVTVYASQAEAKKVELQSKIEAETAKLETAISTQRSRNSQAEANNKNPEKVLAKWAGQGVNAYTKNQLIDFLTNTSGEFDVNKLEDLDFRNATGFSTTAKLVSDYELDQCINCSAVPEIRKEYFRTAKANNQRVRAGGDPFPISNVYIPEVGAKFREKGLMKRGNIDAIFTITSFETLEKSLSPMLEWCPTSGFSMTGGLKTITFKVDFVKSGTDTPVTIDVGYRSTDIDGKGSYTNKLDGTQRGANNIKPNWISGEATTVTPPDKASYEQAVTLYSPYKTLLSRGTNVVVENGQTAIGMAAGVDDDDFDASCGFIYRDVTSLSLKWDCDIASSTKIGNTAIDENNYPNAMLNSFRNRQGVFPAIYVRPDSGELTGSTNAWIGFRGLDLYYKTFKATPSSVSVKTYNLVVKPDPQAGSVDFKDKTGKDISEKKSFNGVYGENFGYTPNATIDTLYHKGYDLVSNNFPTTADKQKFDNDPNTDQNFHVVMTPHIEKIPYDNPKNEGDKTNRNNVTYPKGVTKNDLNKTLTRTIYYKYDSKDGEDAFAPVVQKVSLHRDATFNYVTKEVEYTPWTTGVIKDVTSPKKENYTYDRTSVEGVPTVKVDTKLEDQYVIYKKIPQKGSVDFKDRDTKKDVEPKKTLNGYQAEPFNYTPESTIQKMEDNGYDLVSNDFPEDKKDQVYDKDTSVDQDFHVVVTPHIETIPHDKPKKENDPTDRKNVTYPKGVDKNDLNKTFKRTIYYKYDSVDGEDVFEPVVQKVTLTRNATYNYVTKEVKYTDWTTASIDDVTSQVKEHWQFDREVVEGVDLTHESEALEDQYVIYTRVPEKGSVTFADDKGAEIADKVPLDGFDEDPFNYDPQETLDDLHNKGWDFVSSDYPEKEEDRVYDSDPTVDQDYTIIHTPHIETITPDDPKKAGDPTDRKDVPYPEGVDEDDLNKVFKRTVYFKYDSKDGKDVFEPVEQEVHLTREAYFNYVTGEVEYSEWTTDTMDAVAAKQKDGYTYDRELVDLVDLTSESENPADEYIIYTAIPEEPETTPDTNKTVGPVNTGDGNNATPFIATALASVGGLFATMIGLKARSKRKNNEE